MYYLIDANNLAGRMKLGGKNGWPAELIKIIKKQTAGKKWRLVLVFDGQDRFGDKYADGRLTVIEAPREPGKEAADEKIIEIIQEDIKSGEWRKRDYNLVTDDIELKEAVKIMATEKGAKINFISTKEFLDIIKPSDNNTDGKDSEEARGLTENEQKEINDELLSLWE